MLFDGTWAALPSAKWLLRVSWAPLASAKWPLGLPKWSQVAPEPNVAVFKVSQVEEQRHRALPSLMIVFATTHHGVVPHARLAEKLRSDPSRLIRVSPPLVIRHRLAASDPPESGLATKHGQ